ncbi:hypothetical protein BDN70DRAFT_871164 [Pholiota conissans]|uniref:Uncharacterized protein n=1 Tax=Pholiota conissans TaxID=109636 RepID=A0A9P5ZD49_9AGAR|nr:hypothetical protein BDN70DRAFT_871164 [Pholiota conissans]
MATKKTSKPIMRKFSDWMSSLRSQPRNVQPATEPLPTKEDIVDISLKEMAHCIGTLNRVTALRFKMDGIDCLKFAPHLGLAWSSFSANLQSLSIQTDLAMYQKILLQKPHFPNLTALEVILTVNYVPGRSGRNYNSTPLAHLINSISPRLNELCFMLAGHREHPYVFPFLSNTLPLEKLQVKAGWIHSQDDVDSLVNFLCDGTHFLRELDADIDSRTLELLKSTIGANSLSRLQILKINPTCSPDSIDVLCAFIKCASDTLEQLVIYDVELTQEEALFLVNKLSNCSKLSTLGLRIVILDAAFVNNMATKLSGLKSLDLWYDAQRTPVTSLIDLEEVLRKQSHSQWNLEDVAIFHSYLPMEANYRMMNAFAQSVPSIKSFCSLGHMDGKAGWRSF